MPYDYVLFDAGGTLLGTNTDSEHWYEQFFVDACAEQGCVVSVADVHDVLRRAARSRQFDARCSTDEQTRVFWHHIYSTAFGELLHGRNWKNTPAVIDHLAADYIDRFEEGEFVRLFPDTLPALQALKERGVKMGVVSNFGTYLTTFMEKLGIAQFFDFTLISAAEGCEKPHPEIFDRALKRCGEQACNILFVGDHPEEDYVAARRHGMDAILIDRHDRHKDHNPPVERIKNLTELSAVVLNGRVAR